MSDEPVTSRESEGPHARGRARSTERSPWPAWRLPSLARDLAAWTASVRRSVDAYDADRRLEAELDAARAAMARQHRRARDARLRAANRRAAEYRRQRVSER